MSEIKLPRLLVIMAGFVMLLLLVQIATGIAKNIAVVACIANASSLEIGERTCGIALTVFTLEEQIGGRAAGGGAE